MKRGSNRNAHSLLVGMQNGTATLEDSLAAPYITKHTLTYDPAIALPGIYPNVLKPHVYLKTCTQMFRVGLFTTHIWKQTRYPSAGEWLNGGTSKQ